ncbi:CDC50/LEM3 family [Trypanosoma melophagium]|uniref:CDC50/LEM3 family n=1 Tax=Trypanosoma melophagium TaxID=715481 RepID=UPI003519DDE0|nr:CDC50/LEM3 family [Trypanosoma melophagium]
MNTTRVDPQRSSLLQKYRNTFKNFWALYGRTSYGGNPISQQTLPSFFLYSSPFILLPVFIAVTVIFVLLGVVLIIAGDRYYEVEQKYNDIHRYQYIPSDPQVNINQGIRKFLVGNTTHSQGTRTRVLFEVRETLKAPVYLYYTLDNFYQNFRDFHNGRSKHLMLGKERKRGRYQECLPFEKPGFLDDSSDNVVRVEADGTTHTLQYRDFVYNPCGVAPWSMFNDTFILYRVEQQEDGENSGDKNTNSNPSPMPESLIMICNTSDFSANGNPLGHSVTPNKCRKKGISWKADEKVRYKELKRGLKLWSLRYPYPNDNVYLTNGWYANEPGHSLADPLDYDLQVWLRGAFLPKFRKLLRIIDVDLDEGKYVMDIDEFFDVTTLQGSKGFLLSTAAWVKKDGHGLGIAFLVVGATSFILAITFGIEFLLRWQYSKSLPEPKARWYIFDPNSMEMRIYYEQRTKRYDIPLNETVEEMVG